jgi:tetratricopeptide (TPR) repeat protein
LASTEKHLIQSKENIMAEKQTVEEYIAHQRAALMTNSDCGMTHYNLATALLSLRKFDEAEQEFKESIRCSPNLAEAYVQLGGICLQRGDLDGCLKYNQGAVNARPRFAEGYGNIGFVELQRGNIDKAITSLEKAVHYNSMFVQAHVTLANAYLFDGRIEKSIESNLKALEINPDFAVAYNNLAICYLQKNEIPKAIEYCDKAKALGYEVAPEILKEIDQHRR